MKMINKLLLALVLFCVITAPSFGATVVSQEAKDLGFTTTNLASGIVYTSSTLSTQGFGRITVIVEASHDSAAGGLVIQQSGDTDCASATSPNWDYESTYTYTAGQANNGYSIETIGRCARVSYTNGGTLTTTLRIYSGLKTF